MDSSIAMQIIKRLITCILILVFLLFGSNIAWLIAWYQYDYQTVEIEQDTEAEGPDKDKNGHTGMSSLDIIKEMHSEYMHNLAKVKELMNLRQ